MKTPLFCLAFVGLAFASNHPGWKDNTEYVYKVSGRTLTSLYDLADQYSGIFLKAKLHIQPRPDGKLQARFSDVQHAEIHSQLSDGWNTYVPQSQLSYKQLDMSNKPFQIVTKQGIIKGLIVEKEVANWEANMMKSIISQLQLDLQGKNSIKSPINNFSEKDQLEGAFKTWEETVTGEIETQYDIHRLPEYHLQSEPQLAPEYKLKGDGEVYEVIKSKNYTNSKEMPAYHYGFGEIADGEPTSNRMGQFYTRQSSSRVILTGKASKYTIQSSQTVNKILINPSLDSRGEGSSISALNLTLSEVKNQSQKPQELSDPIEIGNLVYTYERPSSSSNQVQKKLQGRPSRYESSEEQSYERPWARFRRSASQMIKKMQEDDSSSSSSEEQAQYQRRPVMNKAPESPLLPYFSGNYGQSIKSHKNADLEQEVQKIARDISEDFQQPEKILTESTLGKYAMLTSLLRLMDQEEIRSAAQKIYSQSKQSKSDSSWEAFRDAVAEAGTGPAFLNIEEWISSKKIEKYEAARIIASMAASVRVPTEEYIQKFFEMIQKSDVKQQSYLNETALLSFTNLLNKVYIRKEQSHNQYPVYSFNSFNTQEGKTYVKETVIPYLAKRLEQAVSNADSRKIHVYTRALGNIGHKRILEVFEPYLEGDKQVSQFQRMLMVLSMDKLASSNPVVARSALYRIYQNTAEVPEVRVAAVAQLMRTVPPSEMLQRMAENTNTDYQEEVNAAVKSAIENAAQLDSAEAQQFRKAAESARPLLTETEYGNQQSMNLLQDFVVRNMDAEFKQNMLQVGSSDSSLPKGIKYTIRANFNGVKQYLGHVQAMLSSIDELTTVLYRQSKNHQEAKNQRSARQSGESKWASARIAESMNLKNDEREQLEGFFFAEMEGLQRIWSFDNETIKQLPQEIREIEKMLKEGKQIQYTKFNQLRQMALSVPTEMGLPFLYTYDMPMSIQVEGKVKAQATPEISKGNKLQAPDQIQAEVDGFVTITTKVQSQLRLVAPFNTQVYTAGFDKNMQVHIPMKAKVEVDTEKGEIKVEHEMKEKHRHARLLHYSSWPYTSTSDIADFKPVSLRSNTHRLRPQPNTHHSFDYTLGKEQAGLTLRVWGHHPQQSISLWDMFDLVKSDGISTAIEKIWDGATLQQTDISVAIVDDSSSNKATLRMGYQSQYKSNAQSEKPKEMMSLNQLSSKAEGDSQQRQETFLEHVIAGIQNARAQSIDASLEYDNGRKHSATLAFAKSNVDPKSRLVAIYKNNYHKSSDASFEVKANIPNTNELDFTAALKHEPKAKYEMLWQYGQSGKDAFKARAIVDMSRSEERKYQLEESPMKRACMQEMQQGNRQLPACQNMTIEANYLDEIRAELEYENLNRNYQEYIQKAYELARLARYPMTYIKEIQDQGDKIKVKVQFQPEDLEQVNVTVKAGEEETKFYNMSLSPMAQTLLVPHPMYHLPARLAAQFMAQDNIRPTCVIDESAAQTFNNRTYPLSLEEGWTVMMQYVPPQARRSGERKQQAPEQLREQLENYVVLVKESSNNQKEVKIVFNDQATEGKTVEIQMESQRQGSPSVKVNGQKVQFDKHNAEDLFEGHVEIYELPNEEVKLEIEDWFYIIFDGERVKLTATSDRLSDSIVGLCGVFNGDEHEDFTTPQRCIAKSPKKFVESFKLDRQQQSQQDSQECIRKELPLYTDVVTSKDYDKTRENRGQHQESSGIRLRNRYVEHNGEICFSLRPVPECKNQARRTTTKTVPVHCVSNSKTAYYLKNQLDQGGNPDFSHKTETKRVEMEVAQSCY